MEADERPRQIGYADDYSLGCYEWSMAAVCTHHGRFYIIVDSGCSCNSPQDAYTEADACVGPAATLGGLLDELVVDKDKHSRLVKRALVNAVETINTETIAAMRRVLEV